jgi:hypothetical protein
MEKRAALSRLIPVYPRNPTGISLFSLLLNLYQNHNCPLHRLSALTEGATVRIVNLHKISKLQTLAASMMDATGRAV